MLYSVFSKQCVESLESLSSPQPSWVTVAVVAYIVIQLCWGLNRAMIFVDTIINHIGMRKEPHPWQVILKTTTQCCHQ